MDIRTFYKLYRKKPTADKVDLLIESIRLMDDNELKAYETRILHGNNDNARYCDSERESMRERARMMYTMIQNELKV